jgi:hypothetical protein
MENIFITNDNNFKLGKILINVIDLYIQFLFFFFLFFLFFYVIEGDYGISRKEGVSMTAGLGTLFVTGNE